VLTTGPLTDLGMCVPSTCTEEDVSSILAPLKKLQNYTLLAKSCHSAEVRPELDFIDAIYMSSI